ncbi:MAG: hypothetical protein EF813_08090 [Methanosarcinales archaeon]|nr:MAG: hypothetical protein EF813_08090 [Methanosarcinales archaeon]
MMVKTDLDILDDMIMGSAKVDIEHKSGSNKASVTLKEPQFPKSEVTIYGLPHNAIVIKVDTFKSPDTILTEKRGQRKRSDYIIVANKNDKKNILHIEIKATKGSEKDIIKQLKGSVCFVGYCKEIAKEFWHEKKFLSEFESRFVSITRTGSINKRQTRLGKEHNPNDTPEHMMKLSYPHKPQFNMLVGA